MAEVDLRELTVQQFVDSLGDKAPVPGGGAAAAVAGALAAALGRMVTAYSQGRKSLAEHADLHDRALRELSSFARLMLELAAEDAAAYETLNSAMRLGRDDPARAGRIADGAHLAVQPPRAMLAGCLALARLLEELCGRTNAMLVSDLAIAGVFAEAAGKAAWHNVAINLPLLADERAREQLGSESDELLGKLTAVAASIAGACNPSR